MRVQPREDRFKSEMGAAASHFSCREPARKMRPGMSEWFCFSREKRAEGRLEWVEERGRNGWNGCTEQGSSLKKLALQRGTWVKGEPPPLSFVLGDLSMGQSQLRTGDCTGERTKS